MAQNGTLSRKQERAITALLMHATIRTAAAEAHISERSLHRWLQDDEAFQAAYAEARRQAVNAAIGLLQQSAGEAVEVLRNVMLGQGHPASARVTAARSILEMALRATELDELAARLAALEESLEENRGEL